MSELSIGPEEKSKLDKTIDACVKQLQEIKDIRDSMKDLIKSVAEELNLKPKVITKAVNTAFKSNLSETNEDHENMCAILEATGRG